MKDVCVSCLDNSDFEYVPYDDHLNLGESTVNRIPMELSIFSPIHHIKRCVKCGYAVYDCEISDKKLQEYYLVKYKNWNKERVQADNEKTVPFLTDLRSIGQYNFVKNFIDDAGNSKLLEIGAGAAYPMRYIQYMKESSPKMYAIEPGTSFSAYYEQIGITKISDHFPDTNLKDNAFDYIHASHWLEHVIDLDDSLNNLKKVMSNDGLLFLEVPNCSKPYFQIDIKDTPHIHFFTEDSIKQFAKKYDFELLAIGTYWLTFQDYYKREHNQLEGGVEEIAKQNSMKNIQTKDGAWLRVLLKNHK